MSNANGHSWLLSEWPTTTSKGSALEMLSGTCESVLETRKRMTVSLACVGQSIGIFGRSSRGVLDIFAKTVAINLNAVQWTGIPSDGSQRPVMKGTPFKSTAFFAKAKGVGGEGLREPV